MPSTRLFFVATSRRPASGALVLLLSVFTTNSGGQSRRPMPEASTGKSQPTPAIRERLTKTQGTTPFDNVHCGMRDIEYQSSAPGVRVFQPVTNLLTVSKSTAIARGRPRAHPATSWNIVGL